MASSEPASYTVSCSADMWPVIVMYAVRGGATVSPVPQSVESTNASGYVTTLTPAALSSPAGTSLLIYGYGGQNSAATAGGGMTLPSPASLLAGSSTGDINNSTGGGDIGILACTTTSPGNATISPTATDQLDWAVEYAAAPAGAPTSGPVLPPGPPSHVAVVAGFAGRYGGRAQHLAARPGLLRPRGSSPGGGTAVHESAWEAGPAEIEA